jgi:hypothetical protein
MHPDLIRVLADQHVNDMRSQAERGLRARLARQARKARRRSRGGPDPLASMQVPDYVDGTVRGDAGPAGRPAEHEGVSWDGPAKGRHAA